ncbi:MAG: single-stranded-DNA-specific exonuclease RecJ [Ruminococcaceae bacterium]|nr:single-stranded-DNA-specific exonuclease RecJ [Oscillospiraceae bacterium]
MCIVVKYGIWNVHEPQMNAVNALAVSGCAPLTAMVLASRGIEDPQSARDYLSCDAPLDDPFLMKDMDLAVGRVALAMTRGEKIAVFGDYDVDGITSTCLLTDFLRKNGADAVSYIPGRMEEGYGLNPIALRQLAAEGVKLIITVDCGITAVSEAQLCKELGIDLVITDHHECKDTLPDAVAVVDPHRPDCTYPHRNLCGVGVAFKLACALSGDQQSVLDEYGDMVCLGTVADVMPLLGENRTFVAKGLTLLQHTRRPGIAALMKEGGCDPENISASTIGFVLAPRINAAGRMGQIDLAVELFWTDDDEKAQLLARALCDLNRQRQAVESEIYAQAVSMLPENKKMEAIVLADESWHQGVVGIVASRMAEEFSCPAFLICLDGEHGKASSRSFGGFNLFASLTALAPLLESYGGHELAAGFTIHRDQIANFRQEICRLAAEYYASSEGPRTVLDADCAVTAELLTVKGIDALAALEPCGNGCPKPLLVMEKMTVDRISMVGSGRHMRLRLKQGRHYINAIYFSATPETASIEPGDLVDVAFHPQVNEFKGDRTVQMNLVDIRPSCSARCDPDATGYSRLRNGRPEAADAEALCPDRQMLGTVWRYLAQVGRPIQESPMCLCRKIVRWSDSPMSLGQLLTCLDIFSDVGLLQIQKMHKHLLIQLTPGPNKADLNTSTTMQRLLQAKES